LNSNISQGNVVTPLRCGGIFNDRFIASFLLSLIVKEFLKSVNIWRSYEQEYSVVFIAREHTDARYWYSNSVRPSVCLSVRPSVTRWYCMKTA